MGGEAVVTTPQKLPRPVQRAREALSKQGIEVAGASLKERLSKKDMNTLGNAFRATLTATQKTEYSSLKSDDDRRS